MASYGYPAEQGGTVYYPAPDPTAAAAQAQAQAQVQQAGVDPKAAAMDGSGAVDPSYAAYYAQRGFDDLWEESGFERPVCISSPDDDRDQPVRMRRSGYKNRN